MAKIKARPAKQTPLHNKNVISSILAEKAKLSQEVKLEKQSSKIKPKLKAEVKMKNWEDEENDAIIPPVEEEPVVEEPIKVAKSPCFFVRKRTREFQRISRNFRKVYTIIDSKVEWHI